jgi:TetR/AcrR family transcriptional repressor of nem operon
VAPLRAFIEHYLSEAHLASPESGCPVAALASEMPRQSRPVVQAAAQRVRGLISAVERRLPPGAPRSAAGVVAAQLVGALQLARALGDNAEGKALLAASRRALLTRYDTPSDR